MPKIDFPSGPIVGQKYSEGGNEWEWTGSVWNLVCEPTPLPQVTYSGISPIDVDVVVDVDGDSHVTVSHENSGVTPGTYNKVTVDQKGHITSAENVGEQNNFVRVLRIPSSEIDFNNDIKDEIADYINQMNPPLVIAETDSKWNIVIDGFTPGTLDSNTEINLWFDNSGSMDPILEPIVNMVTSCLKDLLLPIYGSEILYDQRVRVNSFTSSIFSINGTNVSFTGKPARNGETAWERTLYILDTLGSSTEITRVINLVFQDEANDVYHQIPFDGAKTLMYDTDLLAFRTSVSSIANPDYYKGVIYQLGNLASTEVAFNAFVQAISNGTGNFSGTNGLSDFVTSGKIIPQYNVTKSQSSSFYLTLVRNTLVSMGFTNISSVENLTCFSSITGTVTTSCTDTTGTNGLINITGVTGGSGTGYYFTLNGGVTQYTLVSGASGLADGVYQVQIYDSDGNNYSLGNASLSCYVVPQTYNFNKYICGTCTINGTGAVAYNAALVIGDFYKLTNGEVAEITGLSTNPVTHTISTPITAYQTCAEVPCP